MKYFFRSVSFKILLGTVLIISGILLYTSIYINNNVFSSALDFTLTSVQKGLSFATNSAQDLAYELKSKEELKFQVDSLQSEINDLRDIAVDYYDKKRENAKFTKYYDFKQENSSLKFVPASVIGRDSGEFFYSFLIDQGSNSGISVNDAVITERGFVGCVYQVNPNSCRVKTILSSNAKVGVLDIQSNDCGVISGNAELAAQNLTRMMFIPAQNEIKAGNIVVSSGLSGMYPKNLKLGQVEALDYDSYETVHYAKIKPFEDVRTVRDVFVVTDFQGKGEIITSPLEEYVKQE